MDSGGFFDEIRHLDFFPGSEKQIHCEPVSSSTARTSDPANQGIYQDEESVDLSALLESCNSDTIASDVATTSVSNSTSTHSDSTPSVYNVVSSTYTGYPGYLAHTLPPHHTMYGNEGYSTHHHINPMDITPNSPSMVVDHAAPSPRQHIVQIEDPSAPFSPSPNQNRPAPGKAPRPKSSKKPLDKHSDEYRLKRDRNNIAVRKSREKSRIRVQDTEKRVKELEEENGQLQSKVAMLTKELNVLKNLFTSAGVSQPSNFSPKDKRLARK